MDYRNRLHHMGIYTKTLDKAVQFYCDAFGLTVQTMWVGDYRSAMLSMGAEACIELLECSEDKERGLGCCPHIAIKSRDIEADYKRALDAGATPIHPPIFCDVIEAEPEPVQFYSAAVHGIEGEEIALIQEIGIEDDFTTRFHHVAKISNCMEKSLDFYQNVMGFKIGHIWGRGEKTYLVDIGCNSFIELQPGEVPEGEKGYWDHISLKVPNIFETFEKAVAWGAKPIHAPYLCSTAESRPEVKPFYCGAVFGPDGEGVCMVQEVNEEEEGN